MEIKGADSLIRKLNTLGEFSHVVEQAVGREILRVQGNAVMLCPTNHGELRQSIKTKVKAADGIITGTVYTNKSYASYVEFGTGPIGQANHQGISPQVSLSYVQQGWWFPADEQEAQKYHWPSMEAKDGTRLYFTRGQPAQPFLYPALKDSEKEVMKNLEKSLLREIKTL